jgi:prepilin-type N-terminal cleavage/methylation domain-containing protein
MPFPKRAGFTLLELLLATAIGALLMAGLYVAMDIQLRHAQAGRELIEQTTLVRALLNRITADISASAGPQLPTKSPTGGSSAGGSTSQGTNPSSGSSTTTPASGSANPTNSPTSQGPAPFNQGVQGDGARLMLSISRVPRELNYGYASPSPDGQPGISDLRRVTYWLTAGGLARQEVKHVTSDEEMNTVPPEVPDEAQFVIAEEVRSLQFSYFDGNAWQDSWDGTQPGPDGTTPMGPPLAVAVTIGIAQPGSAGRAEPIIKTYRHVVAILAANGPNPQTTGTTTGQ